MTTSPLTIDAFAVTGVGGVVGVEIYLSDLRQRRVTSFTAEGETMQRMFNRTNSAGELVVELIPNAEYTDPGTYYTVKACGFSWLIIKTDQPQDLLEAVEPNPIELPTGAVLDSLADVETLGALDGAALVYDLETGTWRPGTPSSGVSAAFADLTDVELAGQTSDGEVLTIDLGGTVRNLPEVRHTEAHTTIEHEGPGSNISLSAEDTNTDQYGSLYLSGEVGRIDTNDGAAKYGTLRTGLSEVLLQVGDESDSMTVSVRPDTGFTVDDVRVATQDDLDAIDFAGLADVTIGEVTDDATALTIDVDGTVRSQQGYVLKPTGFQLSAENTGNQSHIEADVDIVIRCDAIDESGGGLVGINADSVGMGVLAEPGDINTSLYLYPDRRIEADADSFTVGGQEVVLDDDPRLTDARAPTAHGHAFSDLTGTATDGQIPATIARDSELPVKATPTETNTGTDNTKFVTPADLFSASPPDRLWMPTGALGESWSRRGVSLVPPTVVSPSGKMMVSPITLYEGVPVTFIGWETGTASSSITHCWMGLYDASGAKLRVTADDTTTPWAANTRKTLNLATTYTPTATVRAYAVLVVVGTVGSFVGYTTVAATAAAAPMLGGVTTATYTDPASAPAALAAMSSAVGSFWSYYG